MKRLSIALICLALASALLGCALAEAVERPVIPLWEGEAPYTAESPGQAQPSMTAYAVEGADTAMLVVPGGSYFAKMPYEGAPVAEWFSANGVSCYVLDYRVAPCSPMAPLTDAQRALRRLRAAGYARVGILGFSAGGNVACCAAVHWDAGDPAAEDEIERCSCRPDFLVSCYSVVSFMQFPHLGSVKNLLGDGENPELRRYFSAELNVAADMPPAFIWHTADDAIVPVQNSLLLADAMARAGVPFELHIYPSAPHGLGLAQGLEDVGSWPGECLRFIRNLAA